MITGLIQPQRTDRAITDKLANRRLRFDAGWTTLVAPCQTRSFLN